MRFRILPIVLFIFVVLFFFKPFVFENKLPIPSDTIVGLYHPFRDLFSKDYPNGIPYKNSLITDPVRQQYPWRDLVISAIKRFEFPLWNPYNFSGIPLLANFQSAVFYPFNFIILILPLNIGWSVLIIVQPILAGIFLYLCLRNLSIHRLASFLGAFIFAFCGFSIAWMEWGTILHVALWLPLALLSIDKIFFYFSENSKFKIQNYLTWGAIFALSLCFSFFAGHLQIFFYLYIFSAIYFFARWIQFGKNKSILFLFVILNSLFLIITSIQWLPTLQFILLSARNVDQIAWTKDGWFMPWQHLIQFVVPDFFGNPTTLNYWGVWNYGEFIGYVGIAPLVLAIFAMFFRHDKKTIFFGTIFFVSFIFALPTFLAKLPYLLQIPFFSTAQPTRLLFVIDFSLAVLAAFGFDYFIRAKNKSIIYPLIFIGFTIVCLWTFTLSGKNMFPLVLEKNIIVAKSNLILPTILFGVFVLLTISLSFLKKQKRITMIVCFVMVGATMFDLLRFADKFTAFTDQKYLFPQTKTISFLQENLGIHRFMTTDSRILPPNFSALYKLQTVDGYDPLYTNRYAELIAASERGEPNISPPFGFNRIITPHNYDSKIIDLLGVKYIISLTDLNSPKLKKVFQEGQTRVYENMNVFPRAFFVKSAKYAKNKAEAIQLMFDKDFDPRFTAVIEDPFFAPGAGELPDGKADIVYYSANKIIVETDISEEGFLVLTDSFYPTWKTRVYLDEQQAPLDSQLSRSYRESGIGIHRINYNFRGMLIPKGKNRVEFYNSLL